MTTVLSPETAAQDGPTPSRGAVPSHRVASRPGMPNGRAVLGGLLMAVAALGAYWLATSGGTSDHVTVMVADRDLRAGDVIEVDDLREVSIDVDGQVGGLFGSADAAAGRLVVTPVDAGEFLLSSSTSDVADGRDRTFELTVALDVAQVPGHLAAGETVDVFATWNGGSTELIAVQATVVDVTTGDDGLIGGGALHVRLQLADVAQTEATVHGHNAGELTLVRSPVDADVEVGRQYRPSGPDEVDED